MQRALRNSKLGYSVDAESGKWTKDGRKYAKIADGQK